MPDTEKTSIKHRSVLENEKNNYRKICRNKMHSNEDVNSENAHNEPKQWETRLNGKINKSNKNGKK